MSENPLRRIAELEAELKLAHEEVDRLKHDCVSGLLGRQTFEDLMSSVFSPRGQLGIIMVDIDHFKKVNDDYDHIVGDEVIAEVAKAIKGCHRSTDHVARYGGEEFVSILPRADTVGLALLSERIRSTVQNMRHPGVPWVTVSVGFALQKDEDESSKDVLERADHAMFAAKEAGRNQVGHCELGRDELKMIADIDRLNRE
jgi:diguanylate cyclase